MEKKDKKLQFGKVVTIHVSTKSCSCKSDKGCSCDGMCNDCRSQRQKRVEEPVVIV